VTGLDLELKKEMLTVLGLLGLRNVKTLLVQMTYPERNGSVSVKNQEDNIVNSKN
jgi:hypothetical protein